MEHRHFVRHVQLTVLIAACGPGRRGKVLLVPAKLLWAPNTGKTPTILNLTSAARVLEDFTYYQQFTGDNSVAFQHLHPEREALVTSVIVSFGKRPSMSWSHDS
jgi:hypothetical protein